MKQIETNRCRIRCQYSNKPVGLSPSEGSEFRGSIYSTLAGAVRDPFGCTTNSLGDDFSGGCIVPLAQGEADSARPRCPVQSVPQPRCLLGRNKSDVRPLF